MKKSYRELAAERWRSRPAWVREAAYIYLLVVVIVSALRAAGLEDAVKWVTDTLGAALALMLIAGVVLVLCFLAAALDAIREAVEKEGGLRMCIGDYDDDYDAPWRRSLRSDAEIEAEDKEADDDAGDAPGEKGGP